ncbi:hypothetical protein HYY70_01930 [Candidatus Woesearchaeota archaeon]|nr:hypothetical protein [Candidatus Woesearchaeota archaeon]
MITRNIRKGLSVISNPDKAFIELKQLTLEDVAGYYIVLLVLASVAAGVANFLFSLGKAFYLEMFFNTEIKYGRMINYSIGSSTALIFFYMFAGTFFIFLISAILSSLIRKMRYIDLLKILLYSLTPVLLFGWTPLTPFPLMIWSIFLLINGIKSYRASSVRKGSISQRY